MVIGFIIFAVFAGLIGLVIYKYERPSTPRGKMTGRGGDFQDE
jgi:hypothetical protein